MRRWFILTALPALAVGMLAGCGDVDDEDEVGFAVRAPRVDVIGAWQGTGEITGSATDPIGAGTTQAGKTGFRFPAFLILRVDGSFTLLSAHFPVVGQGATESRQCDGVYAVQRGVISLFPAAVCRPLPVARFSVRPGGANRLVLEAVGGEFGDVGAGVRVRYVLERAEGPLGVGFFLD